MRRRQICLWTSFVSFSLKKTAQINISHDTSTALSLDETNPQNCRRCYFLLISGDKEEECWSFLTLGHFFEIVRCVFVKFRSFTQTNKLFFFFNLKTAKFPSLPPSPSQSVVKLRHRREEEEEEADMEHVFNFWILFFSKQCCESYELWFCPYFVVHMWGNFAKCENILTSATPRPVRC